MISEFNRILRQKTMNLFGDSWYLETSEALLKTYNKKGGYVYFISNGISDSVKIGMSKSINKRLNSYCTVFSKGVFLKGFIYTDDYRELEIEIHELMKSKRLRNEWFKLGLDDLDLIRRKYDFVDVRGFYNRSSQIFEGDFKDIDVVEKDDDEILFLAYNRLPVDERIYNSELVEFCNELSSEIKDIDDLLITKGVRRWSKAKNIDISFNRDHKGRYFRINKK